MATGDGPATAGPTTGTGNGNGNGNGIRTTVTVGGLPALKVWIKCDESERIRRIVDRDGGTVKEQADVTWAREQSEADRYRRYYGADLNDLSFYDLVLDSTHTLPDALAAQVEAAVA